MRFSHALALILLAAPVLAQEAKPAVPPPVDPAQQVAQLKALAESVVTVEYTLRYDNGLPPRGVGFEDREGGRGFVDVGEGLVRQERPMEVYSYLIADDLVISEEVPVHERFIEKIEVRFRDQVVAAA